MRTKDLIKGQQPESQVFNGIELPNIEGCKDVFISYKRENATYVARLFEELKDHEIDLFIKKVRPARVHIYIDYDGKLKTLTPVRRFAHFPNSVNALSALESTEYMMKINDNWDKITNICEIL